MKSILPALISTCALVASTTPLFGASQGCVEDQRRSTELGHALGVLVYDSIIGEYAESVTVEDIAVGLKHASDRSAFQLSGIASIESNPDAGLGDFRLPQPQQILCQPETSFRRNQLLSGAGHDMLDANLPGKL